jgi:gas vesicle protein
MRDIETGTFSYSDEQDLSDATTPDLVKELLIHGKAIVEVEAERLKGELKTLKSEVTGIVKTELGGVSDEGRSALAEARQRVTRGIEALKRDLKEQKEHATAAAKPMAIGGVLLHAAVFTLIAALVLGLATLMPDWVAALLVGVAVAGVGALLIKSGSSAAKKIGRDPLVRTNQEMKEDKLWMNETRAALAAKIRNAKSALSDVELPKLRQS